jgi:glycosyltransferase 2 family protein
MKKRLSWFACSLMLVIAGVYVARRWNEIRLPEHVDWAWFAAGTLCLLAGFLTFARVPQLLLRSRDFELPFRKAAALTYVATLGKYLPGKVWSVVGALWLYHREGVPRGLAATCVVVTMLLSLATGGVVGVGLGATGLSVPLGLSMTACFAVGLAIFLNSGVFRALVERLVRRWPTVAADAAIARRTLWVGAAVSSFGWLLCGVGFACIVLAAHDVDAAELPRIVALFAFAQTAGFLALFAPAGIGVREGMLVAGLAPLIGEGEAIVIAAFARIWQTTLELSLAGFGWWILRDSRSREAGISPEVEGITATSART